MWGVIVDGPRGWHPGDHRIHRVQRSFCHSAISSIILLLIVKIVCLDTAAPYMSSMSSVM